MLDRVDALVEGHKLLLTALPPVLEALKDQSLPLDERWAAYVKLVENNLITDEDTYGDGLLGVAFDYNRVSLYDDFNIDRGQSSTYSDMWEAMNDEWFTGGKAYTASGAKDKWREAVLANSKAGFTYDW